MSEEATQTDLSTWFSTYGLLTCQRIFERFNIQLSSHEIVSVIKNPHSYYYQLLRVPLKNVFNGIILQQAHDYQVYAQKLFIDYLLSGEGSKDEEVPGANTREDLELQRTNLIEIGDAFNRQEEAHSKLIAESQASLIQLTNLLQKSLQAVTVKIRQLLKSHGITKDDQVIKHSIRTAMIHHAEPTDYLAASSSFWGSMAKVLDINLNTELQQQLTELLSEYGDPRDDIETILGNYLERTEDLGISFRSFRSQFYDLILSTTEFIKLLPDYRPDEAKILENRESLYFDAEIGDDSKIGDD